MLMGHLNHARFLLGGPNFGAGRPFSLKNDHLGVLGSPARRQGPYTSWVLGSLFQFLLFFFDSGTRF